MDLTKRQQEVLTYLQEKVEEIGRSPSLREAAVDLGVSHNAVALQLKELVKKGVIERTGRYSRDIRFCDILETKQGDTSKRELPLIGEVTAGLPLYAQQESDGVVVVDPKLFPHNNLFCLRVDGNSMKGAGIFDGDLVICEPCQYAREGDVVVALLYGEEATVKRFFLHPEYIELRPENSDFSAVRYEFNEVLIQGKVVGLIRDRCTF